MAKTILQFIDSKGPHWSPDWGKNENAQQEFDKRVKSLKDFLEKYKNIHEDFSFSKDISNYFKIDSEEGYIEMLIDTKEILIPENYDNFLSKFFASDVGNNRGAGMGQSPFDDEFYKDLFNIFKNENNEVNTEIYVGVSGNFDGAYEVSVSFKEDGLHWEKEEEQDFEDYDEDEFESHGYCQDCGEELWSSEDDTNISKTKEGYCFLCESK